MGNTYQLFAKNLTGADSVKVAKLDSTIAGCQKDIAMFTKKKDSLERAADSIFNTGTDKLLREIRQDSAILASGKATAEDSMGASFKAQLYYPYVLREIQWQSYKMHQEAKDIGSIIQAANETSFAAQLLRAEICPTPKSVIKNIDNYVNEHQNQITGGIMLAVFVVAGAMVAWAAIGDKVKDGFKKAFGARSKND